MQVLQQLFMIERLRRGVLSATGAALDPDEDFSGEDKPESGADATDAASTKAGDTGNTVARSLDLVLPSYHHVNAKFT